jgi:hypothetical protein
LNVFRTVGDEARFAERLRESAVVDLPKVIGRDVVWRDSFGRLLILPSWTDTVDEADELGTVNMLIGVDDSCGPPLGPDASATGVSTRGGTRCDLSGSEGCRSGGGGGGGGGRFIEMAIMVNGPAFGGREYV